MPTVQLPNGDSVDFPEGMSPDEMGAAIQSNFPEFAPKKGLISSALDKVGSGIKAAQDWATGGQKAPDPQEDDTQELVTSAKAWQGAGAGRGSILDPRRLDTPKKRTSVLEGVDMPEPQFNAGEAERLSNRDYAEKNQRELDNIASGSRPQSIGPTSSTVKPLPGDRLSATLEDPHRKSLGGLVLETAGDAVRGSIMGAESMSSGAWDTLYLASQQLGGLGDFGRMAKESGQAGRESSASWANTKDTKSVTQSVFQSTVQSLMSAGLTAGFGNASIAIQAGISGANAYGEARAVGKSNDDSLERAAVNTFAEFIGEKIALPGLQKAMKQIGAGGTAKEFAKTVAEWTGKELVGEELTTNLENLYEKFGSGGLRPNMTMADHIEDMVQTFKVTLGQSLLMGGVGTGANAIQRATDTPARALSRELETGTVTPFGGPQTTFNPNLQRQPTDPAAILAQPDIDSAVSTALASVGSPSQDAISAPVNTAVKALTDDELLINRLDSQAEDANVSLPTGATPDASIPATDVLPDASGIVEPGPSTEQQSGIDAARPSIADVVPAGELPAGVDAGAVATSDQATEQTDSGQKAPQSRPGSMVDAAQQSALVEPSAPRTTPGQDQAELPGKTASQQVGSSSNNTPPAANVQAPIFTHTVNKSGNVTVKGDPAEIRAAFTGLKGVTVFADGKPTGVMFGLTDSPAVLAQLTQPTEKNFVTPAQTVESKPPQAPQEAPAAGVSPSLTARQAALAGEIERAKAKTEAAKAARGENAKPVVLSVGRMQNSAEPVTVKNGVIHIGKYPAQNFDTGEDVAIKANATPQEIAQALRDSGAIGARSRIFGLEKPKPIITVPVSQRAQEPIAPTPDLGHIGRDNTALIEGGKPFKAKADAQTAKKQQPMMRVLKVKGGFVLAPKTESQIKANEAAAKRLSIARTGQPGVPIAAHEFIAGEGGLNPIVRSDLGIEGNPRIGNRRLYARKDSGLTLEQATQKLLQDGYLKEGQSQNEALTLIKRSLTHPQYTPEGTERMAQAQQQTLFEEHLAAEQEASQQEDFDPFQSVSDLGFELDDTEFAGYDAASDPIKIEVNALLAQADSLGIDTDSIKENAHENTREGSEQDYFEAARDALKAAIETSNGNRSEDAGAQGNAGEQGLTSPTRQDVLDQQARQESAAALDNKAQIDKEAAGQTLTRQVAPEQRRDTSGDMFAQEKAQAEIDKRNSSGTVSTEPDLFAAPSNPIAAAVSALQGAVNDLAKAMAPDKMDGVKAKEDNILPVGKSKEDLYLDSARKELLRLTDGSANIYALAGRDGIPARVKLMAMLTGKDKVPQSEAGITAITAEFYKRAGINQDQTPRGAEIEFQAWAQKDAQAPETTKEFTGTKQGDFYEIEGDNAKEAARILNLTLTKNRAGEPMVGWSYHAHARMVAELAKSGVDFKMAEPTQSAQPAAKAGGKISEPSKAYGDQTETSAFKAWFGGSKVVNPDGTPMVMYHGTASDVASFDLNKGREGRRAIYVSPEPDFANFYAGKEYTIEVEGGTPNVMPMYVKAENPFDYDSSKDVRLLAQEILERLPTYIMGDGRKALVLDGKKTLYSMDVLEYAIGEGEWALLERPQIQDVIKALGFDSFHVKEGFAKNLGVFNPTQVKSATGNNGNFDATNPNIVKERNEAYNNLRGQLELFLDSKPDPSQSGASVTVSRRDAATTVEDLHSLPSLLAKALSGDLAERQRTSLVGQTAKETLDFAALAQLYRHPTMEIFRVFFTNANDKLVSQVGLTARLPSSTVAVLGNDTNAYLKSLGDVAKKQGATGYYLLHNHPSGLTLASREDVRLTGDFSIPGLKFRDHVIIDTNEYTTIDQKGNIKTVHHDFGQMEPQTASQWRNQTFQGPQDVMRVAKQMEVDNDAVTLIVTNSQYKVVNVTSLPHSAFTSSRDFNKLMIARAALYGKGANIFAVGRDLPTLMKIGHAVIDAVHITQNGQVESLVQHGLINTGRTFPENRRARITPDTSAEFNYLREASQRINPYGVARVSEPSLITEQSIPETWQTPDTSKMDNFIYTMQDKHIDTKRVVKAVRDAIGAIADQQDPYLQEELFHNRAAMATKEFLEKQARPILIDMQARGVEMSDFEEYLHNRHAERRNVQVAKVNPDMQDGGSGIDTADARAYLAGLSLAKERAYKALAARIDQINRDTRALLVSSGLEKQETIDAWQAAYGDEYVPLMREEMENGMGIGQGFSVRGSSSKRAMGSDKPVANILANVMLAREKAITRSEKRKIGEALYGLVLEAPNPNFWLAIDPALEQNPSQILATSLQLIDMGMNPADAESIAKEPTQRYINPKTGLVESRINPAMRSAENVLAVRIDGEDKYVFFNKSDERAMRMAKALKNLDADQLGQVMGTVAKMTRYFAAVNTQYNPVFGVTNIIRDVQTAMLNLQSTELKGKQKDVLKHILPALRGIYIDLRDHRQGKQPSSAYAQVFEEFQREGGATGYRDMYANAEERADSIRSEIAAISDGKAKQLGKGILNWLSDYNEAMENAVRVSAYMAAKDNGMSNQRSASLAKNLTVNFNRKGQAALQAGALFAFFNASVQGSARMGQTLFEGGKLSRVGKQIITGGLLLGGMQAMLLAMAGFDDDEPPDFVRERNIVIPIGDKKYITIPMPLGFHIIPNLARVPAEWVMGGFKNTPKRIGQLVGLFADGMNPIGSATFIQTLAPTILDPAVALAENKDWTGKPIAKKDFDSMHPTAGHTRAKDTATPWAKFISKAVNYATGGTEYKPGLSSPTPDQIDYVFGQLTGGVGREIGKMAQVGGAVSSGDEIPLYKIPLVGRFVGTTEGQAAESSRFYENLKSIGVHKAEIDGLKRDRKGFEIGAYVRDNPEARMLPMATKFQEEISKLNHSKRELIKQEASAERIKIINMQITARMTAFNNQVRRMKETAN